MISILQRKSYAPRAIEYRRLAVTVVLLLVAGAGWRVSRDRLLYHAACSSIGYPERMGLIAAAIRRIDPRFPNDLRVREYWRLNYDLARPDWIAWSSVYKRTGLGNQMWRDEWQVTVANRNLEVKGTIASDRLSIPPADPDGDGSCEVMTTFYPARDDPRQDLRWWAVVRLGDEHNEITWSGMVDHGIWTARNTRLEPVWRDINGDGTDELAFVTVEAILTPQRRVVFKPSQTIAIFEWDKPGGVLVPKLLPDDCGILSWSPPGGVPMQVDQDTDLKPLVRELLPVAGYAKP